jgi:pimeloyl-ACP methyl ester carboxylesterase
LPERPPVLDRGETIVCLHGAGGNLGVFDGLFDALAGEHSLVAFDQPAHGRSGALDALDSIESLAAFTLELLDRLQIPRAVVLGHSMGGAIAQELARSQPARVRALVLSATAARFDGIEHAIATTRRIVEGKERRAFVKQLYAPDAPPEVMQRGFLEDLKTDPRAVLGDYEAIQRWQGGARSGEIRVPTQIVHGEHEVPELAAAAAELAKAIAGARLAVIPGAAHKLPIEQPAALAAQIREFLAALPK